MSKARRSAQVALLLFVSASVVGLFWTFPHFWPVFVFPGLTLVVFQMIALSPWRKRQQFFTWTDYVHYGLMSGLVAIGSQYVIRGDLVSYLNAQLEEASLDVELSKIDSRIPTLRGRLIQVEKQQRDPDEVWGCLGARWMQDKSILAGYELERARFCDAVISLAVEKSRLPGEIQDLESRRESVVARKTELSKVKPPATAPDLAAQLIWAPTLLLCGITLKLGKTTAALTRFQN